MHVSHSRMCNLEMDEIGGGCSSGNEKMEDYEEEENHQETEEGYQSSTLTIRLDYDGWDLQEQEEQEQEVNVGNSQLDNLGERQTGWLENYVYRRPPQMQEFEDLGNAQIFIKKEAFDFLDTFGPLDNSSSSFYVLLMLEQYKNVYGMQALLCKTWIDFCDSIKRNKANNLSKCPLTENEMGLYTPPASSGPCFEGSEGCCTSTDDSEFR